MASSFNIRTNRPSVNFNVNHLRTFEWNDEPFSNLVLPPATKSLIKTLVQKHASSRGPEFDDFVHGKGQGLVINLFGSPGVGKTLTAEATSERELAHSCMKRYNKNTYNDDRCQKAVIRRWSG